VADSVSIIRAIVRDELRSVRLADIGVVTSAFPHTDANDANNFECNVKLREGALELRKVPIATPHIGMASAPQQGELVLLSYVDGDPNRAVVVGRLYSEKANPPLHEAKEWTLAAPFGGKTSIVIDKEESVIITAGDTVVTVKKDGNLEIKGKADLKIEAEGNVSLKCKDCKIDASGNIELGDGGSGVITEQSHRCYFTGKPLKPSKSVKAKG
jgi:phage baseplate assembly protein gpV